MTIPMAASYAKSGVALYQGDCRVIMGLMASNSIDAIVTDPPYHLVTGKKGGSGAASLNEQSPAGRSRVTTGFMGQAWDGGDVAFRPETWAAALRVAKPGAYLVAFGGTRTYHRLTCAIEDAGWEIRDCLMWIFGSGFPKSLDVSKAIDKMAGVTRADLGPNPNSKGRTFDMRGSNLMTPRRVDDAGDIVRITVPASEYGKEWAGWGTGLKPAYEPIIVARKPVEGTVADNVLKWGTGAMNIDGCRVGTGEDKIDGGCVGTTALHGGGIKTRVPVDFTTGRWPANVIHDGSEDVVGVFPNAPGQLIDQKVDPGARKNQSVYGAMKRNRDEPSADSDNEGEVGFKMKPGARRMDEGSAARFFYTAKASGSDRGHEEWDALPLFDEPAGAFRNTHPTVKPLALMRYLLTLVSRDGSLVIDPFVGSGSTLVAAKQLGRDAVGMDLDPGHLEIAIRRLDRL